MALLDAVAAAGIWDDGQAQASKKRWSEQLSRSLAQALAGNLQTLGFDRAMYGEKAFYGGLGPKRVDVSYADEMHGLLLAVSVKTISFAPFSKNLKNRFGDLMTEAITLHMRFPYSVVCAFFAFPDIADEDASKHRPLSTFRRAVRLFSLASGRREYTDPPEKFENISVLLYRPLREEGEAAAIVRIVDCTTQREFGETEYFDMLRSIYNRRNPQMPVGEAFDFDE